MSTVISQQNSTSIFSTREASHLQVTANLLSAPQVPTQNASQTTDKSRCSFLTSLLRSLAACSV
jgi:hypothetical protein